MATVNAQKAVVRGIKKIRLGLGASGASLEARTYTTVYEWEAAEEMTIDPLVDDGKREVLRSTNTILSVIETLNLQYGSELSITSMVSLDRDAMAAITGGSYDDTTNPLMGVFKPVKLGLAVDPPQFDIDVVLEEQVGIGVGAALTETVLRIPDCRINPSSASYGKDAFHKPQLSLVSTPGDGMEPFAFLTVIAPVIP